jgi:serine/threonine protein kinase
VVVLLRVREPIEMSSPAPDKIGNYKLLEKIGQGGMGTLYRALDPKIGRHVAIKLIREGGDSDEMRERLADSSTATSSRSSSSGSTRARRSSPWSTSRARRSHDLRTNAVSASLIRDTVRVP